MALAPCLPSGSFSRLLCPIDRALWSADRLDGWDSGIPRLSGALGDFGSRSCRAQLAPRILDVEASRGLMDTDLTISEDSGRTWRQVLSPEGTLQSPMSSALAADRVLEERAGKKRNDGNGDEPVGLAGAPDDRIAPCVTYHDRLARSRMGENLLAGPSRMEGLRHDHGRGKGAGLAAEDARLVVGALVTVRTATECHQAARAKLEAQTRESLEPDDPGFHPPWPLSATRRESGQWIWISRPRAVGHGACGTRCCHGRSRRLVERGSGPAARRRRTFDGPCGRPFVANRVTPLPV